MFKAVFLSLLFAICISQNDIESDFFDDFGSWLSFRKIVEGNDGNFGIGYPFTVTYEIQNIGTQKANNIKIEDDWDWEFVKHYDTSKNNSAKIMFESLEDLSPKSSITFSYKLIPISIGMILPSRANISYSDIDNNNNIFSGISSNWVNTKDSDLIIDTDDNLNNKQNINNNQINILSSSMYSRSISSTIIHWIIFIILCIISIIYPLCQYEQYNGDFSSVPFGLGNSIKYFTHLINVLVIHKARQQVAQFNKQRENKSN